jgi:hypothetical protein
MMVQVFENKLSGDFFSQMAIMSFKHGDYVNLEELESLNVELGALKNNLVAEIGGHEILIKLTRQ